MTRLWRHYVQDILDAAELAHTFTEGMSPDEFISDRKTSFAVIRALEIMGEATKSVPREVRAQYPEVPWREMAGIRDRLAHDYLGVNLDVVWKTVREDLPPLRALLQQILKEYQ